MSHWLLCLMGACVGCMYTYMHLKIPTNFVKEQSWELGSLFSPQLGAALGSGSGHWVSASPSSRRSQIALAGSRSPYWSGSASRALPAAGASHSSPSTCGLVLSASPRQGHDVSYVFSLGSCNCISRCSSIWGEKAQWTLSRLVLDV